MLINTRILFSVQFKEKCDYSFFHSHLGLEGRVLKKHLLRSATRSRSHRAAPPVSTGCSANRARARKGSLVEESAT